ncbi:hypothetical protein CGZ93_17890 [Enemella dayhoffiae]|uniref:Uncharacterized protein n=1 Tax=Enemella dayhoffiae TaxID=2016507 RepID=A0A255GML0_9ACTN|nr:hypothetical protein [Enemella dayhoffiae]OYO16632.1 hypothetical protein CGZ93_17890 [Enemella dayhoffiae]
MDIITIDDLSSVPADSAQRLIDEAMARASLVAPCLLDTNLTSRQVAQFRAILISAIERWNEVGLVPVTSETKTADIFTHTLRRDGAVNGRGEFTVRELADLRSICGGTAATATMPRYTMPPTPTSPWGAA